MKILAVVPDWVKSRCFTEAAIQRLGSLGELTWRAPAAKGSDPVAVFQAAGAEAEVLVTGWGTGNITPEILAALPRLRFISHSAGSVAHVNIAAWKRGIRVSNVMPIMAVGVAEFTVTCILVGLRRFDALLKPALFDTVPYYAVPKQGYMLGTRIIGLVGLGIIARNVVRFLKPFGCKIIVHDPYVKPAVAADLGVELCGLDELMQRADVVSLHAPGLPSLEHMIDLRRLKMLKPGAILVNTARGILIDNDALAQVAAEGKIGVFLDVTRPEPLPADHPLRKMPNVVFSPHIAGPTSDGWPMMGDDCISEVERFLKGQPLQAEVTEAQYANQTQTQ